MKKHIGFIMLGMLALAALAFTACDMGEEGNYWVTFTNRSSQNIQVKCSKGDPSIFTLEAVAGVTNFSTKDVLFTSTSDIRKGIITYSIVGSDVDPDSLIKMTITGLQVLFDDDF